MAIKTIITQKALSPTQISLADYCINPYRGCEFNCLYCYSMENKNIKSKGGLQEVGAKINIDEILRRQLKFINPKRVLLGSTTECFQPAELKYRLSEKILKTLNEFNIPYTILTKSHLIGEYLGLIAENKMNKIYFTLNCESVKILELKSSTQAKQIETIRQIQRIGVDLRIHVGPFIPYLSTIESLARIIPPETKEIDIEFYHHKMGNFTRILKVIEQNFGSELRNKVASIYENENSYLKFADGLRDEAAAFKGGFSNLSLFYIVPDFDKFYNGNIDYQNTLV